LDACSGLKILDEFLEFCCNLINGFSHDTSAVIENNIKKRWSQAGWILAKLAGLIISSDRLQSKKMITDTVQIVQQNTFS